MKSAKKAKNLHPLATEGGLKAMLLTLIQSGAMCGECGYGTRVTSKRWARCLQCGKRVARKELP